ncbi:MAG: NADPH-dependent oxidoreductase [Planctomycetota bacterium]
MSQAEPNPVLATMAAHRSIRRYAAGELADETVRRAVAAAQMASTSSNYQAYSLLRVRDPSRRARLAALCGGQDHVARSGAFFVVAGDQRRHWIVAQVAGRPFEANLETFLVMAIDASLFAQNLALAFESLGCGMCFIGGLRLSLGEVDELLALPPHVFPFFGLVVGDAAEDPDRRPRLPVEAVLLEERYPDDATIRAAIARYDEAMGRYYAERGKPGHTWSGGIARAFAQRRRTDLLDYYRSKGAVLE